MSELLVGMLLVICVPVIFHKKGQNKTCWGKCPSRVVNGHAPQGFYWGGMANMIYSTIYTFCCCCFQDQAQ